ncbi:bestrophin-like domain [Martelella alba]|nr:hypothetical protein [Martelella alba]
MFLFIIFGVVLYALAYVGLLLMARHARKDESSIPIGAFIGTIATSWALSLGFVAADIWTLNAQADREVSAERSAIIRLIGNADVDVLNKPELAQALEVYRDNVIRDEWGKNHNLFPAESVEETLQDIRIIIMEIARSDAPAVIVSQTVGIFDDLQEARNTRLAIASTMIDQYKWYMLLTLTVLTAIAIVAVHADRVRAGMRALALYVLTATVSIWILTIHASPYSGVEQIQPDALQLNVDRL